MSLSQREKQQPEVALKQQPQQRQAAAAVRQLHRHPQARSPRQHIHLTGVDRWHARDTNRVATLLVFLVRVLAPRLVVLPRRYPIHFEMFDAFAILNQSFVHARVDAARVDSILCAFWLL